MELNEVDPRDYVQFELTEKPDAAPRAKGFILNVEYVDGQTNAIPVDSPPLPMLKRTGSNEGPTVLS